MSHPLPMHLHLFYSSQAGYAHAISKRLRRQNTCHFALQLKVQCGKTRTSKHVKTQHQIDPKQARTNMPARL